MKEEPGVRRFMRLWTDWKFMPGTQADEPGRILYAQTEKDGTAVHVAVDGKYAGYILIADTIRKDTGN